MKYIITMISGNTIINFNKTIMLGLGNDGNKTRYWGLTDCPINYSLIENINKLGECKYLFLRKFENKYIGHQLSSKNVYKSAESSLVWWGSPNYPNIIELDNLEALPFNLTNDELFNLINVDCGFKFHNTVILEIHEFKFNCTIPYTLHLNDGVTTITINNHITIVFNKIYIVFA